MTSMAETDTKFANLARRESQRFNQTRIIEEPLANFKFD